MEINEIRAVIDDAIAAQRTNKYRAAIDAGLPADAIRYAVEGRDIKASRLAAICDALGLEFYIGPPRDSRNLNSTLDNSEITLILGLPPEASADEILTAITALAERVSGDEDRWSQVQGALATLLEEQTEMRAALRRAGISEATAATYRVGADLDDPAALAVGAANDVDPDPAARPVAIMDYESAAGSGRYNLDNAPAKGRIWFSRKWLDKRGLYLDQCLVISVAGESMEPILPDGCSILVDRSRRRRRVGSIFVIDTEDGLIVKRLGKSADGTWQLVSDNPAPGWPPQPWPDNAHVAGQVMWMARSL